VVGLFFWVPSPGLIGKLFGSHGLILMGAGVCCQGLSGWLGWFDVKFYDSAAVFEVFGSCQVWLLYFIAKFIG